MVVVVVLVVVEVVSKVISLFMVIAAEALTFNNSNSVEIKI